MHTDPVKTQTNGQPCAEAKFLATLGPTDQPNSKVIVQILGRSETPDSFRVISEHGEALTVHRNKLKPI